MKPDDIIDFWLGELDANGKASPQHTARWWQKDAQFDEEVRRRFEPTWHALMKGEHEAWLAEARPRLAYVLVLDQLSRNMFRGSAQAFAGDARALSAAKEGIARGHDRALIGVERVFLYMPFMHSEQLADQERCVQLFRAFHDETSGALREELANNLAFAERHRVIIARFGRFPHRNELLGRPSTAEELSFLEEPNSSF